VNTEKIPDKNSSQPSSLTVCGATFRMWRQALLLSLLVALASSMVSAVGPFEEANALFKEGKYAEAEAAYEKALVEEDTAAIRFNLGRVREALGDPAGAMLEWERARRLVPGHGPSRDALRQLHKTTGTAYSGDFWLDRLRYPAVVRREIWVVALGVWLLALGLWAILLQKLPRSGPLLGVLGLFLSAAGMYWKHQADIDPELALIRERGITVRAAPADPARSLGDLPAGTPVRILGQSAGWNRCAIPGIGIGWIPAKSMERITSVGPG
jgi:tetratricopeptide (TPR) repeat protein